MKNTFHPAACEPLESRRLLAAQPVGGEFHVNVQAEGQQTDAAVAVAPDGSYVVVWDGESDTPDAFDVFARLYTAGGTPRGAPFRVNAPMAAPGLALLPAVAMDDAGNFVVAWGAYLPDYSRDIYARQFAADGTPLADEFRVNAVADAYNQERPSVAMDGDGDFVVAWMGWESTAGGAQYDVYARRFNAAGMPLGGDLALTAGTPGYQGMPAVATSDAGGFVVSWIHNEPNQWGRIDARLYGPDGKPRGFPFIVSPAEHIVPERPAVAMDADGDFAVAYGATYTGGGNGAFVRRYTAAGAARGPAQMAMSGAVLSPLVGLTMDAVGGMVVAGTLGDRDDQDVYARVFGPSGDAQGPAFLVNSYTEYRQFQPAVSMNDGGRMVAVWTSQNQDGAPPGSFRRDWGVFGKRYDVRFSRTAAVVARRWLFYHRAGAGPADDDAAVAVDKSPVLSGDTPAFWGVSSYDKGLNGIMIDVVGLTDAENLTADDFDFAGPLPASVEVRRGAGTAGSDRITLTWADPGATAGAAANAAVVNGWLGVTMKANAHTGLAGPDRFRFGNLVGDTGDLTGAAAWRVSAVELAAVKRALNTPASITTPTDFNRDGRVNSLDLAIVKRNLNHSLSWIGSLSAAAAPGDPPRRPADDIL